MLYRLDVLDVEDQGEDDQLDQFDESITRDEQGRYQVSVPWIPGAELLETNEMPSKKRLHSMARKLNRDPVLKADYHSIVSNQVEKAV